MSEGVVAESAAMREAVDLARRVADTRSTVLITGETGTGKEIVAGMIHSFSARAHHSFVKVNCAALPETLLESELFGHERGAFTGADRTRIGRFEEASGGTLFLDEIGEVTPATQAKLLRVLQDQEFYRLGGTRALRTDARIVAATNRDLLEARRNGTFREDLYFRLDVIGIKLPPLRERPLDLMALAERLLTELTAEQGREFDRFSEEALACIRGHAWPGNVRELRNVIERAVLTASGKSIEASDLALEAGSALGANGRWRIEIPEEGIALQDVEREVVMATLERVGHVQKEAARLLGISRRKLNYKIQRMGLTHPSWRRNRAPAAHPSTAPANAACSDD
jgi:transcriptional regulator with GAF, ATPase, and Fis domain